MKKIVVAVVFVVAALLLVFGLRKKDAPQEGNSILVSIPVYTYFVEKIVGDTATVHTLVPASASPHEFEPSPKEMHEAFAARGWIRLGEPFETKILNTFREKNRRFADLNLAEALCDELICSTHHCCSCHHHDHDVADCDLHYWLSPRLAKKQAKIIADYLTGIFPQNKRLYEQNLASFQKELDALDQQISTELKPLTGSSILVSHAAFAYFCRDYDLDQLSVEIEGKDPQPKEIARTLMRSMQADVKVILVQPQYNNKGAQLVAQKLKLPVHSIDPYSADYIHNLQKLAAIIAESKEP